ncbi:hypothetical protein [Nitratireductor indicus]|uniref:hypothetical protein n=1 Tax=Nitratireductor indicus TaxID=721133 RepID=UPI0028747E8F|nr:hypothetical protein [Nitratireductor indicus]MDS1136725.1 hypothetical protein [Nitratireductor indicus]
MSDEIDEPATGRLIPFPIIRTETTKAQDDKTIATLLEDALSKVALEEQSHEPEQPSPASVVADNRHADQIEEFRIDENEPGAYRCPKCSRMNFISLAAQTFSNTNCRFNIYEHELRQLGTPIIKELSARIKWLEKVALIFIRPALLGFFVVTFLLSHPHTPTLLLCGVLAMIGFAFMKRAEGIKAEMRQVAEAYGVI